MGAATDNHHFGPDVQIGALTKWAFVYGNGSRGLHVASPGVSRSRGIRAADLARVGRVEDALQMLGPEVVGWLDQWPAVTRAALIEALREAGR